MDDKPENQVQDEEEFPVAEDIFVAEDQTAHDDVNADEVKANRPKKDETEEEA